MTERSVIGNIGLRLMTDDDDGLKVQSDDIDDDNGLNKHFSVIPSSISKI